MRKRTFGALNISNLFTTIFLIFPQGKESNGEIYGNSTLVGDLILDPIQIEFLLSPNSSALNFTKEELALKNPFKIWPNATVPYLFDESIQQDVNAKNILKEAMQKIENASCIRFKAKTNITKHYVLMKKGKICSSKVGFRSDGPQPLIIDPKSCSVGNILHEILHTLSFLHMHTTKNRDKYIEINWDNIHPSDAKVNFYQFHSIPMVETEDDYDYESITHYSSHAFAKNKNIPTIISKISSKEKAMGQRKDLSIGDIIRLNRLYNCPGYENVTNNNKNTSLLQNTALEDDKDDMELTKEQIDTLFSTNSAKRNGLKSAFHHWPNAVVPFEINKGSFSPNFVYTIYEAMNYIVNRTCVRFVERSHQNQNYIYITSGSGCSSEVGMRRTGRQFLNINEKLCPRGKIIHELLHALGFLHMHTANERDNYLKVNWDNIKENAKFNFKQFIAHVSMFSTPYDYNSIMHYSPKAFAKDKTKLTLVPIHSNSMHMGQREGMSIGDIIRLNRMYKCGAPYLTKMPEEKTSAMSSSISIKTPEIKISEPNKNRTIFGVLVFKAIES